MCGDVETNPGPGSSSSKSTVEMFDDHSLSFLVGDSDFELEDELEDFEPRQPKRMRFAFLQCTSRSTASLYFVQEDGADHRQSPDRPDWVRLHACTASLSDAFSLSRARSDLSEAGPSGECSRLREEALGEKERYQFLRRLTVVAAYPMQACVAKKGRSYAQHGEVP